MKLRAGLGVASERAGEGVNVEKESVFCCGLVIADEDNDDDDNDDNLPVEVFNARAPRQAEGRRFSKGRALS